MTDLHPFIVYLLQSSRGFLYKYVISRIFVQKCQMCIFTRVLSLISIVYRQDLNLGQWIFSFETLIFLLMRIQYCSEISHMQIAEQSRPRKLIKNFGLTENIVLHISRCKNNLGIFLMLFTVYINFNPNINFLIVNIIGVSLGILVPGISLYFSKVNE